MAKRFRKLSITIFLVALTCFMMSSPLPSHAGKLKPPKESFTPGDWFLGDTPPNLDPSKPPIVFVQGKNGSSTSWYGETVYHGVNDMYTKAYNAGYQSVFVQLHDAAGNGSASQYANGRLLASMLSEISNHFSGKKVNIIAHSKGGPDTQAALVQYGAYRYVGKVFTLGSPHHGSHLADLSYSWYAGWLGSLLGQQDDGTYSLQTGEMAKFRSVIDSNSNISKNKYYTIAGTDHGPSFSALSMGAAYLSSYGSNDGLVNEWSAKLPYAAHLFTDPALDHDNVRMGSAIFPRIEPYLRNAAITGTAGINTSISTESQPIMTDSSQYVNGGLLRQQQWSEEHFYVNQQTKGTVTVYTASPDVEVQLVSKDGKVFTGKQIDADGSFLSGAYIHTIQMPSLSVGDWTVRIKSGAAQDAYLLTASFFGKEPVSLEMPGVMKAGKGKFIVKLPASMKKSTGNLSFNIHLIDRNGNAVKQPAVLDSDDGQLFTGILAQVPYSGVYNMTIDIKRTLPNGKESVRSIIRSVYITK
ncbi:MAG: esterase/lipase family protein [Bacillus sp. (in: firmicutes)]